MMYGVFSGSESIDSDECEESLRGFPQKVSPPSFVMFFKASKTKEIFWACIKFKSLSNFKLHQCVRYTHDYSIYSFCEVQLQICL